MGMYVHAISEIVVFEDNFDYPSKAPFSNGSEYTARAEDFTESSLDRDNELDQAGTT